MPGLPRSLEPLLRQLGPEAADQVVATRSTPARAAVREPMPAGVHGRLRDALANAGIHTLFDHQARAWEAIADGGDVVIVTATSSGKTLCFNLPILSASLRSPRTRALYLYPTKALANDQAAALAKLTRDLPVAVGVYHGETDQEERARLRAAPPHVLISNPDTLHHNQLARHADWSGWWSELQFVVIDEAHAYRGVFGSHVGHVLRRVRRVAANYGADPRFISASATIGNPSDHVEALIGRRPVVIDRDGSPQVPRDFVLWRPSMGSELETARLLVGSAKAGISAIGFSRSRVAAERIRRAIRRDLARSGHEKLDTGVAVYRAGLPTARRRQIEAGLRDGSVRSVISTNALELGIDIGSLEVAVLSSYPGSTMAFRQQAGRAGRRDSPALVMMVIGENPLDEYIAEHPDWAISAGAETAAIDPANESVATGQLGCAARELPLGQPDRSLYGEPVWDRVHGLTAAGVLTSVGSELLPSRAAARPRDVNLRSLEGNPYSLLFQGSQIGDMDARYVATEAHPGAIYLQDGEPYRVSSLDRSARSILLEKAPDGVLTRPLGERFVNVRKTLGERQTVGGQLTIRLCDLHVRSRVAEYQEMHETTRKPLGNPVRIDPVILDLNTQGVEISSATGGPGLHAVEHLIRALAPLIVICDPADLDGHTDLEWRSSGAAYVFDRTPGGSGLSAKLFEGMEPVIADAGKRLGACGCQQGCPLCIHLGSCMLRNEQLSKKDAASLLDVCLSRPPAAKIATARRPRDHRSRLSRTSSGASHRQSRRCSQVPGSRRCPMTGLSAARSAGERSRQRRGKRDTRTRLTIA